MGVLRMRFYFEQETERERHGEREEPTIALALIRFGVKQWKSSWCDGENDERASVRERES